MISSRAASWMHPFALLLTWQYCDWACAKVGNGAPFVGLAAKSDGLPGLGFVYVSRAICALPCALDSSPAVGPAMYNPAPARTNGGCASLEATPKRGW